MKIATTVVSALMAVSAAALPAAAQNTEKAKTLDELATMFDVSSCKDCHTKIHEEWAKSYHATSLVGSPRTLATIATTVQDGMMKEWGKSGVKNVKDITVEHMMSCAKCHLPQLEYATDEVAQEIAQAALDFLAAGKAGDDAKKQDAIAKVSKVGINCIVCHNLKAITHKWVDGEVEPNVIYGSSDGPHDDKKFTSMKKSPIMTESIICGQCHGLGPNFDLPEPTQCATLYGSYLHSYVPSGGSQTCQECHMHQDNVGHFMPGYRSTGQASRAVEMTVDAHGYYFLPKAGDSIPTAVVKVDITGKAGHRIPDG